MAAKINRLTARKVQTIIKPGLHADGAGLYLSTKGGGRRWVFVWKVQGKRREMGLGSANDIPLARARELAAAARAHVSEGRDPIMQREAERLAASVPVQDPDPIPTFGAYAETFIASVESGWRNATHRQQWRNTLAQHAGALSDKSVAEINTADVLAVLRPIWTAKPETARRLRARIERILSAAKSLEFRPREAINPAQYKGHLDGLLPKQSRLSRGHHPAMPYAALPVYMRKLADRPAMAARALEFLIHTAARSGEVIGATWGEISDDVWTVPADRMKAGLSHTVPLPPAAMAVLAHIGAGDPAAPIFPAPRGGKLSNMALEMLLRRTGAGAYTTHGFRSAFKDWALDCTEFPDEVSEETLAHVVGSKVRRAYRRGEALDRRRRLLETWANYLAETPSLAVVRDEAA